MNCGAEFVPVIYNTRKNGITEVISPARRAVNELGCLKEFLIAGTKSWIYLELYLKGPCETSINFFPKVCDFGVLIITPGKNSMKQDSNGFCDC